MLIVKKKGYQQNNPWWGSKLNTVTNLFRQKFSSDTVKLHNSADNGKEIYEVLYSLIGESGLSDSISDIVNWVSLLECSLKSPHISYNITARTMSEVESLINQCQDTRDKKLMAFEIQSKIEECFKRSFIVIQRLQDAVLDNKMEVITSVISEYNSAFDMIEEEICTGKIASFSNEKAMYGEVCIAYSEFLERDQELRTQKADHDNKKSMLEDEMISEEKILSEIEKELSAAQDVVTQEYHDTILTLDVDELLKRYKNEYTTILRVLKSSYKKDRNTLKDYSKYGKKASYAKALQLLNDILSAQSIKTKYDEKRGRIEELKNRINEQQSEIDLLIEQIQDCTEQLQETKTDAIEKHQSLCSKLEEIQITCSENADNEKSNCENIYEEMSECLNDTVDDSTNFELVHSNVMWLYKFVEICDKFKINLDYRKQVCEFSENFNNRLTAIHTRFVDWKNIYEEICKSLFETFDESVVLELSDYNLQEFVDRITACSNSYSMLEYYVDYKNIVIKTESTGVAEYIRKVEELKLDSDDILPSFKKCFFRSWLDNVLPKFDAITTFRGEKQEKVISDFKTLDKEHMDIARARLKAKLISELPNLVY